MLKYINNHMDSYSGQHNYEAWIYNDNEPIGIVQYVLYKGDLTVSDIFVRDEYRRKGYGSRLMKYIKEINPEYTYKSSWKKDDGAKFIHKDLNLDEDFQINFERGSDAKKSMGIGIISKRDFNSEMDIIDWLFNYPQAYKNQIKKWYKEDAKKSEEYEENGEERYWYTFRKEDKLTLVKWIKNNLSINGERIFLKECKFIADELAKKIFYEAPSKNIKENINFERGIDPKKALNLGVREQIRNYLIKNDLEKDPRKLEQDEILLDWACELDKLDWVENLLKMGVSPNADPDNPLDSGCLDEASFKGNIPLMELLLKYGADVTHKNYISLRYAAGEGHFNAVKLLLEAGADPFVFSGEDLSTRPLRNLTNIVKLILKYQEKAKESFVKESYNFERGKDPKEAMELGTVTVAGDRGYGRYKVVLIEPYHGNDITEDEIVYKVKHVGENKYSYAIKYDKNSRKFSPEVWGEIDPFINMSSNELNELDPDREILDEDLNFERGIDPKSSMEIGKVGIQKRMEKEISNLMELDGWSNPPYVSWGSAFVWASEYNHPEFAKWIIDNKEININELEREYSILESAVRQKYIEIIELLFSYGLIPSKYSLDLIEKKKTLAPFKEKEIYSKMEEIINTYYFKKHNIPSYFDES